jgi:hypothetical protein
MKDKLKRFIASIPPLEYSMFLYFHLKGYKKVQAESEKRKSLSLFDYENLCADIPFGPEERVIDNNLYGQAHHLKKYAGITTDLKAYLEHGCFWGGMVHEDAYHWHFKKIITWSENRKRDIEKKIPSKEAIPVGPFIHYAEKVYDQETFKNLKNELGKVLLVFPGHSIINLKAEFDTNDFIQEIEKVKVDFDTVLISLYYIDAKNPAVRKTYESKGYRVVTSGNRYDQNFIARQKTYIELADFTMSNEVGTHIGNSVHLGKPHYVFQQKLERKTSKKGELERHNNLFSNEELLLSQRQQEEVAMAFSDDSVKSLTQEQKRIADKYWGSSSIKTREELRELFG